MEVVGQEGSTTSTDTTRVRLFVGGLGESISSEDLRKIFSSLGVVESLEIIRTKGRSFAYIDFLPSSQNSLSKLLSTYNGCVWRGGKLRLEKAKEHYLARLRREWDEDAQLASTAAITDVDVEAEHKEDPSERAKKKLSSENKQLRIFFPRLRKVKSIPFNGTGKHKYSFRRVEVPPLPTYFCDCEEHSGSLLATEKQVPIADEQDGRMDEKELDMMNSVMNRLFERERVSNTVHAEVQQGSEENPIIDDLQSIETEGDSTEDEDSLVINMVKGQETVKGAQKSRLYESGASKAVPTGEVLQKKKKNNESPKKNRMPIPHEEDDTSGIHRGKGTSHGHSNESRALLRSQPEPYTGHDKAAPSAPVSGKSSWRGLLGDKGNLTFKISDILPGTSSLEEKPIADNLPDSIGSKKKHVLSNEEKKGQPEKRVVEGSAEAQPAGSDSALGNQGRGSGWLHQSSWTQLLGGNKSNSFSISQIIPGISFEKQEAVMHDNVKGGNSTSPKNADVVEEGKREPTVFGSVDLGTAKCDDGRNPKETNQNVVASNNESSTSIVKENCNSDIKEMSSGDATFGESCVFMRTATSQKEWANAKAALNKSRKRKSTEK